MLSRKITYSILIIISIFFYIFFLEKLSLYILAFVLLLPVVLFIILLIGKYSIKYKLCSVSDNAIKKENCCFKLNITNKSIFPFPWAIVTISYQNQFSDNYDYFYIVIPIHARTTQTLNFKLSSQFCGILNVNIENIKIYDYIKLFSLNISHNSPVNVYIIPDAVSDKVYSCLKTAPNETSTEFSKEKSGDDSSEIFELKDYIPGDKINRIHWNLSSKQNQFITKHYSLAVDSPVAVICDISFDNGIIDIAASLEMVYGICFLLIENGIKHELYIGNITEPICVSDYESLNEGYIEILKYNNTTGTSVLNNNLATFKPKLYLVTNKPFKEYLLPEIPNSTELKCFFLGNGKNNEEFNCSDNVAISYIDCESFENVPDDVLI